MTLSHAVQTTVVLTNGRTTIAVVTDGRTTIVVTDGRGRPRTNVHPYAIIVYDIMYDGSPFEPLSLMVSDHLPCAPRHPHGTVCKEDKKPPMPPSNPCDRPWNIKTSIAPPPLPPPPCLTPPLISIAKEPSTPRVITQANDGPPPHAICRHKNYQFC